MDIESEDFLQRLQKSIRWSEERLRPRRDARLSFLRQYVGRYGGYDKTGDRVPLNMIELALNTFVRLVAANRPQVLCVPKYPYLKVSSGKIERDLNHRLEMMEFGQTLRLLAFEGMVGAMVCMVGVEPKKGKKYPSEVYADWISLDDWFCDMAAERYEGAAYAGHRYVADLDDLKADKKMNQEVVERLENRNLRRKKDRAHDMETGGHSRYETITDQVELRCVYVRGENKVLTLVAEEENHEPLRVQKWKGPDCGPYLVNSFNTAPGMIIPPPPAANWLDLQELTNKLMNKVASQAINGKTIMTYSGQAWQDAQRIGNSKDQYMVKVDNPSGVQTQHFGMMDQPALALALQAMSWFKTNNGNLDLLGGLSPQSPTLGQDELLAKNASQRVNDMQERMEAYTRRIVRSIAHYVVRDQLLDAEIAYERFGIRVPDTLTQEDLSGDPLDYGIDIVPYSMQEHSPASRIAIMQQALNQAMQAGPLLAAAGMNVDLQAYFEMLAKYQNVPEIADLIVAIGPPTTPELPPEGGGKAPNSERRYVRINRPGATQRGQDHVMSQALLGQGVQPAEAAQMGRPNG